MSTTSSKRKRITSTEPDACVIVRKSVAKARKNTSAAPRAAAAPEATTIYLILCSDMMEGAHVLAIVDSKIAAEAFKSSVHDAHACPRSWEGRVNQVSLTYSSLV